MMRSQGNGDNGGRDDPSRESADPQPREAAPLIERISITGLDEQSAEALQLAVMRLATRYGLEVRAEVTREESRSPE